MEIEYLGRAWLRPSLAGIDNDNDDGDFVFQEKERDVLRSFRRHQPRGELRANSASAPAMDEHQLWSSTL